MEKLRATTAGAQPTKKTPRLSQSLRCLSITGDLAVDLVVLPLGAPSAWMVSDLWRLLVGYYIQFLVLWWTSHKYHLFYGLIIAYWAKPVKGLFVK